MESLIYSFLSKEKLEDILTSFHYCTQLPVQLIDDNGKILFNKRTGSSFCQLFSRRMHPNETCDKIHVKASKMSTNFGGTYIFSCPSNLNHMVFPLINKNTLFGSVLVGPFLMDEPDSLLISNISDKYNFTINEVLQLYDSLQEIKVVTPSMVNHISKILYYLLNSLLSDSREQFIINQEKLHQQSKINEAIQMYKFKEDTDSSTYPLEKEKELIGKMKIGDTQEAKRILNDLLGYVFFAEGNSLDSIKTRSIELCSLLSRATIEGGAPVKNILMVNSAYLQSIQSLTNLETLCYKLQEIIDTFVDSMYHKPTKENNEIIKKATEFIAQNYSKNLTLEMISSYVNLSPAYFSSIFKQSTGISFKEHLNIVRIEEGKRLLTNTNYSIIDIAIATGFEDQSYFTKVFKKYTKVSPHRFRKG